LDHIDRTNRSDADLKDTAGRATRNRDLFLTSNDFPETARLRLQKNHGQPAVIPV
jgi:hypothetical protein